MIAIKVISGTIFTPRASTRVNGKTKSSIVVACFMCTAMMYGMGVCLYVGEGTMAQTHTTRSIEPSWSVMLFTSPCMALNP